MELAAACTGWTARGGKLDLAPPIRSVPLRSARAELLPRNPIPMAIDPQQDRRPRARPRAVRIAAVVSTYHEDLTRAMLASAVEELKASGVDTQRSPVLSAPGAFEIPLIARELATRKDVDAVLCFALVLKGETSHDHWVSSAAVHGLMQASLDTGKPLLLGILTCNTLEQARARALPASKGGKLDKGREVARAALAALDALHSARQTKPSATRKLSSKRRTQ